mmetsp:Transcript_87177/g.251428  ORF Transcript_87177/g.251428 Transcript_87177/m.251428 type:complete len:116 (-) Transcript_87177:133-480(-)
MGPDRQRRLASAASATAAEPAVDPMDVEHREGDTATAGQAGCPLGLRGRCAFPGAAVEMADPGALHRVLLEGHRSVAAEVSSALCHRRGRRFGAGTDKNGICGICGSPGHYEVHT